MEEFKCDTSRYKCLAACCKNLNKSPVIDLRDIKAASESVGISVNKFWDEYGSILLVKDTDQKRSLNLGLRYTPFCALLKDDKCSVHDKKPVICRDFPYKENFEIDDYPCIENTSLTKEEFKAKQKRVRKHISNANFSIEYLIGDKRFVNEYIPSDELIKTIKDNIGFYKDKEKRINHLEFIVTYLKGRDDLIKNGVIVGDTFLVLENYYLKFYNEISSKLRDMKFDENSYPLIDLIKV